MCRGREPVLISVLFSFLLPLSELKYHWFDEEQLNPHKVDQLPDALTIKNKSSTFGVRGRVECTHY